MFDPNIESIIGAEMIMDGAANGNFVEEMLGFQMMQAANQQQMQQQQEQQRQLEIQHQQQILIAQQMAEEQARQERIRQQQIAEQRRIDQERKQRQYQQLMGQGNAFMDNKQFTQAIEQYKLALRDYPTDINAKFSIACCVESMNNIQEAYGLFMELVSHGASAPGLNDHIVNCETILDNYCAVHLKYAQNAYDTNLLTDAIRELELARSTGSRSQKASMMLCQIDELAARIKWFVMRVGVNAKFISGQQALDRQEFNLAVECFKSCKHEYANHLAFLHDEDKVNNNQINDWLLQANRGVEMQHNQSMQARINHMLPDLEQAVNTFDIKNAIPLLDEIVNLCAQISNHEDVNNRGYIPREILSQSLKQLNAWQNEYQSRKNLKSLEFAQTIMSNINDQTKLSADDCDLLLKTIQNTTIMHWNDLDRRDLNHLLALIASSIQKYYIQTNNCIAACYYGAPNYIYGMQALSNEIDKIITDNLPQDYRAPIQLDMFKRHTLSSHGNSMLFSDSIPMAQVVNSEAGKGDELKRPVMASLKL